MTATKADKTRKKGDENENFVIELLTGMNWLCELHPRTFRPIGNGRYASMDNDYHRAFDIKAESQVKLLYVQVTVNTSDAIAHRIAKIGKNYRVRPDYVRIALFAIEKIWVAKPHRHKELRIGRILELINEEWVDVDISEFKTEEMKRVAKPTRKRRTVRQAFQKGSKINSKLQANKNIEARRIKPNKPRKPWRVRHEVQKTEN